MRRNVENGTFEDEKPRPRLMNLASHTTEHHADELATAKLAAEQPEGSTNPPGNSYSGAAKEIMEKFLQEGALNPKRDPTRKGFIKLFAAWTMQDNLPFTTGQFSAR